MQTEAKNERHNKAKNRARSILFIVAAAACLAPMIGPPAALAIGAVFALTLDNPFPRHTKKWARIMLQSCVVMLGFQIDFPVLLKTGADGWILAAFTIAMTFGLGWTAGRILKMTGKTPTLISAGTAICGGSAIAAVGPAIGALESEMTVALGAVFTLNAIALYFFPVLGHMLHMTPGQFGLWSGIAIHDISSVVGAAAAYGGDALQTATAVKLARTLWIVPVTLTAAAIMRARNKTSAPEKRAKLSVPWFIGLFILASLARLTLPGVADAAPLIGRVARTGLTVTLFLTGAGLTRATLKAAGWKALLQGVGLWLFVGASSLAAILWLR